MHLQVNGRSVVLISDRQPQTEHEYRLCSSKIGGEVRVEAASGMLSADAVCAAAYHHARMTNARGRCIVMTECGGAEGLIPVVAEPDSGKATAVLPVPNVEQDGNKLLVMFPGLTCVVSLQDLRHEASASPVLFVLRDAECERIRVWFRSAPDSNWTELPSSGLAAAAAAVDLASSLPDGVMEYGIGMYGGTAEVGVSKRDGLLAGLSICSCVAIEERL